MHSKPSPENRHILYSKQFPSHTQKSNSLPLLKFNEVASQFVPLVGISLAGVMLLGSVLTSSLTTRNGIHIRGDDVSASAHTYANLRHEHCQISVQHYQPGDSIATIPFADQPEVISDITVSNSLALVVQCQKNISVSSIDQRRGTSLILELEQIRDVLADKRTLGNASPAVITITLHTTEPGDQQPNPHGSRRIRKLVEEILDNKGVVTIIGPIGELQRELSSSLEGLHNQRICPKGSVKPCIEWAFQTGRKL